MARRQADATGSAAQLTPAAALHQERGAQQGLAVRQEQSRVLAQQQARASHEEEHLKQQIRWPWGWCGSRLPGMRTGMCLDAASLGARALELVRMAAQAYHAQRPPLRSSTVLRLC